MVEGDVLASCLGHTSHVAAAVERAEVAGVFHVVCRVFVGPAVERHAGDNLHSGSFHVFGKGGCICQFDGVELRRGVRTCITYITEGLSHDAQDTLLNMIGIILIIGLHHVLAVVAKEHLVGNDVGANLQLHDWGHLLRVGYQRGTVATQEDRAFDDGRLGGSAHNAERHLFGIGTEGVQGLNRCLPGWHLVVEVAVNEVILQLAVVCIGIGAVAATIDATALPP